MSLLRSSPHEAEQTDAIGFPVNERKSQPVEFLFALDKLYPQIQRVGRMASSE